MRSHEEEMVFRFAKVEMLRNIEICYQRAGKGRLVMRIKIEAMRDGGVDESSEDDETLRLF